MNPYETILQSPVLHGSFIRIVYLYRPLDDTLTRPGKSELYLSAALAFSSGPSRSDVNVAWKSSELVASIVMRFVHVISATPIKKINHAYEYHSSAILFV
jgi:hypothetical protein